MPRPDNKQKETKEAPCATVPGGCQITELFHLLGKAHMLDLLHLFIREEPGPKRFVDLQARLGLSPNTLSGRLKELVAAGLLSRTVYNEIPPRVDYEATDKARALCPVFEALQDWAAKNTLRNDMVVEDAEEVVA